MYKPVDVETTLADGVRKVKSYFGDDVVFSDSLLNDARRRLKESREHGGIVYLSGSPRYASQNALASTEWLDILLHSALRQKHAELSAKYQRAVETELKWLHELETVDKEQRAALDKIGTEDYKKITRRMGIAEHEYHRYQKEAHELILQLKEIENKAKEALYGNTAELFELKIPRSEVQNVFHDIDERKLQLLEESPDIITEVHANAIPPKYIVGHTAIQKATEFTK